MGCGKQETPKGDRKRIFCSSVKEERVRKKKERKTPEQES
jgi:hypothetical protein